jgi:hypothetical protein
VVSGRDPGTASESGAGIRSVRQGRAARGRQPTGAGSGVLHGGRADGSLRLGGDADALGRDLVALEDGYGILVLTGALAPEEVERSLLAYARVAAGLGPAGCGG